MKTLPETETWLQLAPWGKYAHTHGEQNVNPESAARLVKKFHSLKSWIFRHFSSDIKIYIGHPDDPQFAGRHGHTNQQSFGKIKDIKADEEGLWVLIDWTKEGKALVDNGFYRFLSPRWKMSSSDGMAFELEELISVGLTNTPNLPNKPIPATRNVRLTAQTLQLASNRLHKKSIHDFITLVNERMKKTGEDYMTAWTHTKNNHPVHLYFSPQNT